MRAVAVLALAVASAPAVRAWEDPPTGPQIVTLSAEVPGVLTVGDTFLLSVVGTFDDGSVLDVTNDENMIYDTFGRTGIVVSANGAGQAMAAGRHALAIRYSTVWTVAYAGFFVVDVRAVGDTDGDRLPDSYELEQGFDPFVPGDGVLDLDGDTLTNFEEMEAGTDPRVYDTDGDFDGDGLEVRGGTNPLVDDRAPTPVEPQLLDETCIVAAANRTAPVDADGTWYMPNVPANVGPLRMRVTCVDGEEVRRGQSEPINLPAGSGVQVPDIDFTQSVPIPTQLALSAANTELTSPGQSEQLTLDATYADGTAADVTSPGVGTTYWSSNSAIAGVSAAGLVTAASSGSVLVSALHEGALAILRFEVRLSGDSDGDGLPDDYELANGLDPNDPLDALEDHDQDGLSTLEEFQLGLDPFDPDTDDDGLLDGEELNVYGTNPLLADTDGDGVSDGLEVQTGSDPLDQQSVNLDGIIDSLEVFPQAATIVFNTIVGEASQQLRVTATLIDGSIVDATSSVYGTSYSSSDLLIANFGLDPGRVFAGSDGSATATASVGGLSVESAITVQTFAPQAVAFLPIPGWASALDIEGSYAFVASGWRGLQVVDISDPSVPVIVGSADYPGSALGIEVQGTLAYVVGAGLHLGPGAIVVYDVANPFQPLEVGRSLVRGGTDIAVGAGFALTADNGRVKSFDLSDPALPVFEDQLLFPGNSPRSVTLEDGRAFAGIPGLGVAEIDVTDPTALALVAITSTRPWGTSRASGIVARGERLYAADGDSGLGGVSVLDIGVPGSAALVGATDLDMSAKDVALDGNFAFVAERLFVNAVPIFSVESDEMGLRGAIDFSGAPSFRDDDGLAIAARDGWVYLLGAGGSGAIEGDTGLHVGRAYIVQDTLGEAPRVEILSPADGSSILERRTVTVEIDASDDVALSVVELLVDGQFVGADHAPPFRFEVQVPAGEGQLTLSAFARDSAGDESQTPDTVVTVLADQQPTVRILAPSGMDSVSEGSALVFVADATDDDAVSEVEFFLDGVSLTILNQPPYTQSVVVPLGVSQVTLSVTARDGLAQEASATVVLTVDPDQPPSVAILEPSEGTVLLPGGLPLVSIAADDDVGVAFLQLQVDGVVVASTSGTSVDEVINVPGAASDVVILAEALDSLGQSTQVSVTYSVVADATVDVSGAVLQEDSNAAVGAIVDCEGTSAISGADGTFLAQDVSTATGQVACTATWTSPQSEVRSGVSDTVPLSSGEPVNVGAIVLGSATLYGALFQFETEGGITVIDAVDASGSILSDPVTPGAIRGIAFDDAGVLLGVETSTGSSVLFKIDPFAGAGLEIIAPLIDSSAAPVALFDLAVQPLTGTLFGATAAGDVYWVDRSTAVATLLVATGLNRPGVAFLPTGEFYVAGEVSSGVDELREISPADGSTLSVVSMGTRAVALTSRPFDSTLFFLDDLSRLWTVDRFTGAISLVDRPFGEPGGLAFGPPVTALASTTATGRFLIDGVPTGGVTIALGGQQVTTASDGTFLIPGVPAVFGPLVAFAPDFEVLSDPVQPTAGGTTDLGDILFEEPTQFGDGDS